MTMAWSRGLPLVLAGAILTGCTQLPLSDDAPSAPVENIEYSFPQLESLPVKGRAPKTGYERELFGQAWTDDVTVAGGRNGCDTRNDILQRDLMNITFKPGTGDCVVLQGILNDPYTNQRIDFQRGETTSPLVQIDHIVSLSNAWQTGAQQLTPEQRRDLANDPLNLIAVDGPTNQQKGDGDAATWLPPNTSFRCEYVTRQIDVKKHYGLWVTPAEKDAMVKVLTSCATDQVPPTNTEPATTPSTPPLYRNCQEARQAGAAPIHRDEPGYRPEMDGDGDGVACETPNTK